MAYDIPTYEEDPFNPFMVDVIGRYQQATQQGRTPAFDPGIAPNGEFLNPAVEDRPNPNQWYTLDDGTQVDEATFRALAGTGIQGRKSERLVDGGTRTAAGTQDNAFKGYDDGQGGGFGGARSLASFREGANNDPTAFLRALRDPAAAVSGINAGDSGDGSVQGQFWQQLAEMGGFADLSDAGQRGKARDWFNTLSADEQAGIRNGTMGGGFAGKLGAVLGGDDAFDMWTMQHRRDTPDAAAAVARISAKSAQNNLAAANDPATRAKMEAAGMTLDEATGGWSGGEASNPRMRPVRSAVGANRGFGVGWQNPYANVRPLQQAVGSPSLNRVSTRPMSGGAY